MMNLADRVEQSEGPDRMSAERPHGQMIGDDSHRWHDPSSWERRKKARLAAAYTTANYLRAREQE
jgi:hypothetical protein